MTEVQSDAEAHAVIVTALFVLCAVAAVAAPAGENLKWVEYLAALGLLPLSYFLFIARSPSKYLLNGLSSYRQEAPIFLTCLLLPFVQSGKVDWGALALGGAVGFAWAYRSEATRNIQKLLATSAFSALCWQATYRLVRWWSPDHMYDSLRTKSIWLPIVLALTVSLFAVRQPSQKITRVSLWVLGVAGFLYLCGRPHDISNSTFHHQSFFAGPMQLIEEGGTLLWDVPSQYGLLNIYLGSLLNFGTAWANFLFMNKLMIFANAVVIFTLLTRMFPSALKMTTAFILTACASFCWVGWIMRMHGPFVLPSSGAFRFIWPPALLLIIFEIISTPPAAISRRNAWLIVGNLVWLVSSFWSFECFVYGSATWLSYRVGENFLRDDIGLSGALRVSRNQLLRLFGTLFAIGFGFSLVYRVRTGHFPDWKCFTEYASAYSAGGFASLPMDPGGAILFVLILFMGGLATLVLSARQKSKWSPFLVAQMAAVWAVSSYFMSRSHENNFVNLAPQFLVFALSVYFVATQLEVTPLFRRSISLAIFPFLFLLIEATATHRQARTVFPTAQNFDLWCGDFATSSHMYEADCVDNLKKFGEWSRSLPAGTSSLLAGDYPGYMPLENPAPAWLPLNPSAELEVLPVPRQRVYIERFIRRVQRGGWLVRIDSEEERHAKVSLTIEPFFKKVDSLKFPGFTAEKYGYIANP